MEVVRQLVEAIGVDNLKYIAIALVIIIIIAIVKRAIKLAITIIVVALIATFIVKPVMEEIEGKYSFRVEDGVGIISVEGTDYKLSKEACEKIEFEELDDTTYTMTIQMDTDDIEIDIPSFLVNGIESFAESQEISVETIE